MDYKRFQSRYHVSNKSFITEVQTVYPRYSKIQHSMCCQPEKYGICLLPAAEKLVTRKYVPKRTENREKPNRVSARLDDETFQAMRSFLDERGLTMQDFIAEIISKYLEVYQK